MVWQLWSRNRQGEPQGVFSHATALTLHDLSDVMPAKLDMTVPPGFRRMAAIPDVLRLRHARLSERDVQTIDGVRVTTPLRTLVDVIAEGAIAQELQVQAVDQALRRGLIMRRHLETARVSTRARQRIDRTLKQVHDGSSTPVRNRRRVSKRTGGAAQRTGAS
jgi:predicted transcriptional regulator of viral defense system